MVMVMMTTWLNLLQKKIQAKDVQTYASSRSLFQTQYGSHGRELAEKTVQYEKVKAQYAFEESCNLGILILDHSCHSCHSCHSLLRIVLSLHQLPWTTDFGAPTQVLRMMCPKYQLCLGWTDEFLRHHPKLWDSWQIQLEGESSHLHTTNNQPTTTHPHHLHQASHLAPSQEQSDDPILTWKKQICYNLLSAIKCISIASYWNNQLCEKHYVTISSFNLWILRPKKSPSVLCVATKDAACIWQATHRQKSCQYLCRRNSLRSHLKCRKIFQFLEFRVPQPAVAHLKEAPVPEIKRTIFRSPDLQIHKTPACSRLKGRSTESFEETQLRPLPRETTFAHMWRSLGGFLGCFRS